MTKSILLVGVGGQGTILASKLLTTGLMNAGYDVKMSEIHGMSQRGIHIIVLRRDGERICKRADCAVIFAHQIVRHADAINWVRFSESVTASRPFFTV